MSDIAPELIASIREEFNKNITSDKVLKELSEKISAGSATYADGNKYAIRTGEILSGIFKNKISADILPDGRMYYNIADRLLNETFGDDYKLISSVCEQIQNDMNAAAGMGLKAIVPEKNQGRIDNLIDKISDAEDFNDVEWCLQEPVVNFSQSIVDDSIKANAEFQFRSGRQARIDRKVVGGCCRWCKALAGSYEYPDVPDDVYRRHENCRCTVTYFPSTGKAQDVWSKKYVLSIKTDAESYVKKTKYRNVFTEYMQDSTPGRGNIEIDAGMLDENHEKEVAFAKLLHKELGGDIHVLEESKIEGKKNPDYLWNGQLWDLKNPTTERAAEDAIRRGIKQIENNPGGVILDYENINVNIDEVIKNTEKRMLSKGKQVGVDILIFSHGKMIKALRY